MIHGATHTAACHNLFASYGVSLRPSNTCASRLRHAAGPGLSAAMAALALPTIMHLGIAAPCCPPDPQVVHSWSKLWKRNHVNASDRFVRTLTDQASFRARLDGHVAAMASLGLNAHALGRLTTRHLPALLGTPETLVKQFVMFRDFFAPWGGELVDDMRRTTITAVWLPAVVQEGALDVCVPAAPTADTRISRLLKAVLAGPNNFWAWTEDRLTEHMRSLVAAGLFTTEALARRGCMLRPMLLAPYKLAWYVWRKAAVLEAGGTMGDVHLACSIQSCLVNPDSVKPDVSMIRSCDRNSFLSQSKSDR